MGFVEILSLPRFFLHFEEAMSVTPSLPSLKKICRQPLISYRIFLSLPRRRGQKQRLPLPKRAPEQFSLDICRA
jgi:hypothetical protein